MMQPYGAMGTGRFASSVRLRLIGALAACLAIGVSAGCRAPGLLIMPVSPNRELVEQELYRTSHFPFSKIAVIDVTGVIHNGYSRSLLGGGEHPVSMLLEQLDKARRDPWVKGVILRINSPGGTVAASELMHEEIAYFRKQSGKPIVAVMMDYAASGGYYIACACDEIVAQESTVTGSIGVIMQMIDLTGSMQKIGLRAPAITSGPMKDSGSPFRSMTDDERAYFQTIIDDMFSRFVQVVDEGRPGLNEAEVRTLADGRVYTAHQALEHKLVDRIATMRDTVEGLQERFGVRGVRVVAYGRAYEHLPNYYAQPPSPLPGAWPTQPLDVTHLRSAIAPQFLYLWAP